MMDASLSVITCDKCGKPMIKGQSILVRAEGKIANSDEELDFEGCGVRYACHLGCWDGVEVDY
jgi:hypothetical protein